jgi:hypothetical protein
LPACAIQEEKDATARLRAWRKLELDAMELACHMLRQHISGAQPKAGKAKRAGGKAAAQRAASPPAKRRRTKGAPGAEADDAAGAAAEVFEKPDKAVLQAQVRTRLGWAGVCNHLVACVQLVS